MFTLGQNLNFSKYCKEYLVQQFTSSDNFLSCKEVILPFRLLSLSVIKRVGILGENAFIIQALSDYINVHIRSVHHSLID